MAAIFGGPKSSLKPDYTGLQLQTATATLPIPILWGQSKLAPNVVFYDNFRTNAVKSGGKGGLFSSSTTTGYNYSADVILALCEGPISNIGYVWRDQSTYTLSSLGFTLFDGTTPQTTWSYLSATYPNEALAYQGTAYVCAANYQLGSAADIGNHNFEVVGILAGTGINGIDADPAQVIYDFLTNAQYGAGFDPAAINLTTLYGSGGDASLQTYCRAMGIAFSPLLSSPEQGSSVLSRWLQLLNCAAVWSGGQLKFIPYGDQAIAAANTVKTITAPIPIPAQLSNGDYPPPTLVVSTPANFVADGGVVYAFTGVALTYVGASAPGANGQYGITPAGTYVFHLGDQGSPVTITATIANPTAYAPNLTPVYPLTDLDFLDTKGNQDPVQASRADPYSLPTIMRVECLSRDNQYGTTPVEARDQSQIELYGPRAASSVQAHEICDELIVAPIVAQTILQRQLYVRAKFAFKLSWEYCLLDPMDIVTITDANLGLSQYPVRIVSVEEDDKGILSVTAEELVVGVSTPGANPSNGAVSFQPNQGAAASVVNTPLIYEPPPALTNNVAQVWVGASGGSGGVVDPNWGGAFVWASVDNATYSQIGAVTQPLRQGALTAPLPAASGWDTTHTLAVSLAESGGVLSGTSAASAQAGATLSLVDGELLAYETATLTGAYAYNLMGLQRGLDGSTPAAHSTGAAFARLDGAVVPYTLPDGWVGVPLYFKFQSFNVFGAGVQELSTCVVYDYTPTGTGALGPVTQALLIGTNLDFGSVSAPATEEDDFGAGVAAAPVAFVDLGAVSA
jgi:hypothetical protein